MATRWYTKTDDTESGPLTLADLAKQMADGVLCDHDLVRSDSAASWHPAEDVPGLHRMALKISREMASRRNDIAQEVNPKRSQLTNPSTELSANDNLSKATSSTRPNNNSPHITFSRFSLIVCAIVLLPACTAAWFVWDDFSQQRRFPLPARLQTTTSGFRLPLLGTVSHFEMLLLVLDAAIICGLLGAWIRGRWKSR